MKSAVVHLTALVTFIALAILFQNCSPQKTFDAVAETDLSSSSDPISITSYPSDMNLANGSTLTLAVSAVSSMARSLSYQWFKNGIAVGGATGRNLIIYSATMVNSGYYHVAISDGENTIETRAISINVQAAAAGIVSFTKNPTSSILIEGSTLYLGSTAVDSLGLAVSYQWYFNGTAIANATSSDLYITNVAEANEGYYHVAATSASGTQKSSTVFVTVNAATRTCAYGTLFNGHCYFVSTSVANFAGAYASCLSIGGYPAKVTDTAENYFIYSISGGAVYLGATDDVTEGTWKWRDGSVLTFTSWASGEPNNNGNEDCTIMRNDGLWNDGSCATYSRFVCEVD